MPLPSHNVAYQVVALVDSVPTKGLPPVAPGEGVPTKKVTLVEVLAI